MSTADAPGDKAMHVPDRTAADHVRFLARLGLLADRAATASGAERAVLRRGAYKIVWPVVFEGLTRAVERSRGHHVCAIGVDRLQPDCVDRYQDDVEAVLDDLLRKAKGQIHNVEGWVRRRLTKATIDGHRRRRGGRGALQRPRMPRWLAKLLGNDRWLTVLAIDIQTWVGVPATAGAGLWPYGAWADRRAAVTGDPRSTERDVARDVETVLAAMRQKPAWYERFIEQPLGRKQAPLPPASDAAAETRERPHLALTERHESDDALLQDLAAAAIDAIEARLARGEDLDLVVVDVIRVVFGSGVGHIDRVPGAGTSESEQVPALLADPERIDRIVRQVRDILGVPDA